MPAHDILFLRRDITQPEAIDVWLNGIERGRITSVLAEREGVVQGYATVDRGELSWSPHVAELRVLVSATMRGKGLGRVLTQEAFAIALGLGFRPEALLRDHVKDREGRKYDLLLLAHEVANFQGQMDAYGITKALED